MTSSVSPVMVKSAMDDTEMRADMGPLTAEVFDSMRVCVVLNPCECPCYWVVCRELRKMDPPNR